MVSDCLSIEIVQHDTVMKEEILKCIDHIFPQKDKNEKSSRQQKV